MTEAPKPCDCQRRTPELALCSCMHPLTVHEMNAKKQRKACTHMDEKGQCPCPSPR